MDLYEAQTFFASLYAGKNIAYEFDATCQRHYEMVCTNGLPNMVHHVENNQVKVTVDGMAPFYVPIMPHRMNVTWSTMKMMIAAKADVYVDNLTLQQVSADMSGASMVQICSATGLTADAINKKISAMQAAPISNSVQPTEPVVN